MKSISKYLDEAIASKDNTQDKTLECQFDLELTDESCITKEKLKDLASNNQFKKGDYYGNCEFLGMYYDYMKGNGYHTTAYVEDDPSEADELRPTQYDFVSFESKVINDKTVRFKFVISIPSFSEVDLKYLGNDLKSTLSEFASDWIDDYGYTDDHDDAACGDYDYNFKNIKWTIK